MQMLMQNKKGQISSGGIIGALLGLVVAAILIMVFNITNAMTAKVTSDIATDFVENTSEYNITQEGLQAQLDLSENTSSIAQIIVISVIIGLLLTVVGFFVGRNLGG